MLEDYAEKNGFTGIRHFTDDRTNVRLIAVSAEQRERARQMLIAKNRAKGV